MIAPPRRCSAASAPAPWRCAAASALAKPAAVERRPSETFTLPTACRSSCCRRAARRSSPRSLVYKVGSADETYGKTGIAHFLEHMMFKGTGAVAADRVLAHRVAQRRPRQRLHRLRHDRLPPDHGLRPARAGDAHGSRPHGQPAHPREGADARAPGRARGAAHADRQRAGRAARRGGARAAVRPPQALRHADRRAMSTT